MEEFNSWQNKVLKEILSCKDPTITTLNDINFFAYLFFNRNKYNEIIGQIKAQDWGQLQVNDDKCETDFQEDLTLVKFINQNSQLCVATIYDNEELWQDPQVIDIIILS